MRRFDPKSLRLLVALALIVFCAVSPARAARISPLEGLELARKGFSGLNDFTAEITQEKQIALMKKKLVSSGTVRFRRPDSFLMEINPPRASRVLLKDNVLNLFLPAEGIRQKTILPAEEGLLRWLVLLDRPLTSLPEGLEVQADRQGETIHLTILPKSGKGVRELRLTLHEDGRPKRLAIEERNRDRTEITFRNVRKNVGLTEKDFRVE